MCNWQLTRFFVCCKFGVSHRSTISVLFLYAKTNTIKIFHNQIYCFHWRGAVFIHCNSFRLYGKVAHCAFMELCILFPFSLLLSMCRIIKHDKYGFAEYHRCRMLRNEKQQFQCFECRSGTHDIVIMTYKDTPPFRRICTRCVEINRMQWKILSVFTLSIYRLPIIINGEIQLVPFIRRIWLMVWMGRALLLHIYLSKLRSMTIWNYKPLIAGAPKFKFYDPIIMPSDSPKW